MKTKLKLNLRARRLNWFHRPLIIMAGLLAAVALSGQNVHASDITWNGNLSTGAGTAWRTGTNWVGGIVPTNTDNAIFDSAGTVTICTVDFSSNSGTQQVGSVTLGAGRASNLSIRPLSTSSRSGTLFLNGINGILLSNVSSAASLTFEPASTGTNMNLGLAASGNIYANAITTPPGSPGEIIISDAITESGGSRSLTLTGPGIVFFQNTNSYSGSTTVSNGSLEVDATGTFGNGAGTIFLSGGNIQCGGDRSGTSSSAPAFPNPVVMNTDTFFYNRAGNPNSTRRMPFSGNLTGTGTLKIANPTTAYPGESFIVRLFGVFTNSLNVSIGEVNNPSYQDTTGDFSVLELCNSNNNQTFNGTIFGTSNPGSGYVIRDNPSSLSTVGGSTTFTGNNTYFGGTIISSGTLFANNTSGSALGSGAVTVTNLGTLGGNGTIVAPTSVSLNGTISPGATSNGIANLAVSDLTLGSGARYIWQITSATGVAGTDWDLITCSSSLTDAGSSGSPITIKLDSLGLTPTGWNSSTAYDWVIIQGGTVNGFDSSHFVVDTSSFSGALVGAFSVNVSGGALHLIYTPGSDFIINVPSGSQSQTAGYGTITGATNVVKVGAGESVFDNAANTYSGVTRILAGTLSLSVDALNGSGALGANSSITLLGDTTGTSNAMLNINVAGVTDAHGVTVQSGSSGTKTIGTTLTSGTANYTGSITLNNSVTLSAATGGIASFAGNITGSGGITFSGGTITMSGVNSYSGTSTLTGGTLNLNAKALGTNTFTISAPSTLDNTGSASVTLNSCPQNWNADFNFAGTTNLNLGAGPVVMSTNRTLTISNNTLTVGGTIAGNGGLVKLGAGTLALAGATNSTYTGGTTNSAGVLSINGTATLGDGTGTLLLNGGYILNTGSRASLPIANPVVMATDTTIYGNSSSTPPSTRDLPFSGNWTVTGGTLRIGNIGLSGDTFNVWLTSGNDMTWPVVVGDPSFDTPGAISGLGFYNTNSAVQTVSGLISGSGQVTRGSLASGAGGTTVFVSNNTYSGGTVLDSGTIGIGLDSTPNDGTPVVSGPLGTGTFEIDNDPSIFIYASGGAHTIGNPIYLNSVTNAVFSGTNALTFTGSVNLGSVAKTLTVSNTAPVTFSGLMTNSAALNIAGSGILILTAQNTFTNGVELASGTIGLGASSVTNGSGVVSGPVGVGTFTVGAGTSAAKPFMTVLATAGSTEIDNNLVFNGQTNIVFAGGNFLFTGPVNSGSAGKTLTISNSLTTFSGVITNGSAGSGSLTKAGSGTLVFSGNNTYVGTTTVNAGTLLVNGAIGTNIVTVNSGATLGGTGILGGSLTFASSGAQAYLFKTASAPDSPLTVSSNLTLNGNTVIVDLGGTTLGAGTYTLINYGGNLSGTFNAAPTIVNGSLSGGNAATISLSTPNQVNLVVGPASTTPPGFSPGSISRLPDGNFSLTATGAVGTAYRLWATTNLALQPVTSTWTLLQSGTVSASPFTNYDLTATNFPQRFYLFSTP